MFDVDHRLLSYIAAHRISQVDAVATRFAAIDSTGRFWWMAMVGLAALIVSRRSWRALVAVPAAFLLAESISSLLKLWLGQRRPFHTQAIVHTAGFAMPSDHAAYTAALAVVLVCAIDWGGTRARRNAAVVIASATAIIGALMIYAGVHWLSDVLVGWVLGVSIGVAVELTTAAFWPTCLPRQQPTYDVS